MLEKSIVLLPDEEELKNKLYIKEEHNA